jgi:antitoxin HicB
MSSGALSHVAARDRRMSSSARQRAESTVEHYAGLPYHLQLVRDGEERAKPWTASVEELPGCTSRGRTSAEALNGIQEAMANWIATALKEGRDIPEPKSAATHSGRLLLRMPRSLHADLTRASEREGVSLNQFITDVLASAVAWHGRPSTPNVSTDATAPISQVPGGEGVTAEPTKAPDTRRNQSRLVTAALAANFVIVGIAAIVAIAVLIAAWL